MISNTEQFNNLIAKYALSRPISLADQRYILKRRKASLKILLKKKGAYSVLIMIVVGISTMFKKMGINLSLVQSKIIAGVTAAAVSTGSAGGAYKAALYIKKKISESKKVEEERERAVADNGAPVLITHEQIKDYYHKLEEVNLDDGSRLIGAVIYQDRRIARIHTIHGVIEVPVKSIKGILIKER
ncbi:MAG: hypothetical protein A2176_08475 [Spirochaetes bacterium RBG_13_51_14]|nr:MAG: hypothetical protein A2176_08475 [Spirochaetes bacterium RBG_13_51_14]